MKAFIKKMVQALVDLPDEVSVEEVPGEIATTFRIHVAPSDVGKVLGKHGRIADAMRVLAKASAMKHKRRVYLDVKAMPASVDP
jgi:predicted RNA-binding protein YlqC (UPF0109 family)